MRLRLRAIMIDWLVDGINVVREMDAIVRLGDVTVNEARAIFGDVGALSSVSPRQESGKSCKEK